MTDSRSLLGGRIVKGMIVLIFFGLFLKLGGFLMSLIVSRYYGLGDVTASFMQIYTIVIYLVIYATILSVVLPAFMPVFSEARTQDGEEEAWKLASTVTNGCIVLGVAVAIGSMLFATDIIRTLVPGFEGGRQAIAVSMLRIMAPGIVVFLFAAIAMGILNSYKIFSYPSAAEAAHRLGWAVAIFLLIILFQMNVGDAPYRPIVLGFLLGCAIQATVLLFGLRKQKGHYRLGFPALSNRRLATEVSIIMGALALFLIWSWGVLQAPSWFEGARAERIESNSGLLILTGALVLGWAYAGLLWFRTRNTRSRIGRFAMLAAPLLIGVLFARYRDLVGTYFQSYTEGGDFAAIELAKKIVNLPTIVVAYSLSIAMFPFLCDLAARKDSKEFGAIYGRTIRMIALFFVPLTVVTVVCGEPVMRLVFDPGVWSPREISQAGLALSIYSTALFFYAVENVMMQTYFSMQKVVVPTLLGIVLAIAHVGALYVFIEILGFSRPDQVFLIVLIVYPASRGLKNLILMGLIRSHVDTERLGSRLAYLGRLAGVTLATGVAAWLGLAAAQAITVPDEYKPAFFMVDTFNPEDEQRAEETSDIPGGGRGIQYWEPLAGVDMAVDEIEEPDERIEHALGFSVRAGARRRLDMFAGEMADMARITFKAKTPTERLLRITLEDQDGSRSATVSVQASETRETYSVPLADFYGDSPIPATLDAIVFADEASEISSPLWLDNVAFDRPAGVRDRVRFEISKGVHVALPGLGATIAFVAVCLLLRVEEFRMILDWIVKKQWKKARRPNPARTDGTEI